MQYIRSPPPFPLPGAWRKSPHFGCRALPSPFPPPVSLPPTLSSEMHAPRVISPDVAGAYHANETYVRKVPYPPPPSSPFSLPSTPRLRTDKCPKLLVRLVSSSLIARSFIRATTCTRGEGIKEEGYFFFNNTTTEYHDAPLTRYTTLSQEISFVRDVHTHFRRGERIMAGRRLSA